MERYLYIFIILVIFLCICLVCNGCMNLYDRFSVGNDSSINISQNLKLSSSGSDFKCVKPSPVPSPVPSPDDQKKCPTTSDTNYQLFNGECKKACKNDYHSYNSLNSCQEASDLYYIYRKDDNRICRQGPHTDSYTYNSSNSCNEVISQLDNTYKIRTNASAICPLYNSSSSQNPENIFRVDEAITCPVNGFDAATGEVTITTRYYFEKEKGYQPIFVKCDKSNETDPKTIYPEEIAKVRGSDKLSDIITQNEYYNSGNGDKYTNTSGTDIIKDLWYCDWENFCCKYNPEKGRLSLQECNSQCIPPDPNPNYSVPDKYEIPNDNTMDSSGIINYNALKSLDSYHTTLLKGYIKSTNRDNYITDMINHDKYPSDRIFVFNNYTSDSIAIILTIPGMMGGATAAGGQHGGDATKFITDLKSLITNLKPYSDNMILDGGIDKLGNYTTVNKIIVGVIEKGENYKLKIPTFKDFGNGADLKSSFPSVNLAFVKNDVDYIKYNYKQLIKDGTARSQIKTDSFNNISGGSVIELTLNNSNQTGVADGGENSGVPQFITDLPDYYDLSVIPPSSVGAHMNASTTAYNESADIDLTDKTYKDDINIKCENSAKPKPGIPNLIPGKDMDKKLFCDQNPHNTRWCDLNCSITTETGPNVKPGKGKLPEYGNIYGVNIHKDINGDETDLWGCGIPDNYNNMNYYKDTDGPGYSIKDAIKPTCLEYYDGNKPDFKGSDILKDKSSDTKCNRWSTDTVKRAYRDSFRCGLYTASDNSNINIFSPDSKAKYIGPNYNIKIEPYNDTCNSPKLHIPFNDDLNDINNRFSWDMSKLIKKNNYKDVNAYVYPYQDELGLSEHGQATANCRVNLFQSNTDYDVYDLEKIIKDGTNIYANGGKYAMKSTLDKTTISNTDKKPVFLFSVYDLGKDASGKIKNDEFFDTTHTFSDFNASRNVDKYKGYIDNCSNVEYRKNINDIKYFSGSEEICNNYKNHYYCNLETYTKEQGVPGKQILDKLNTQSPFVDSKSGDDSTFIKSPCKKLYTCEDEKVTPLDKNGKCRADNKQECVSYNNCSWTDESYNYNTSGTCYIDYTKYMDTNSSDLCGQYYNASLTGWNKEPITYNNFKKYINPKKITTQEEANIVNENSKPKNYGALGGPFSSLQVFYETIRVNCPESDGKSQSCEIYVDKKQVDDPLCSVTKVSCLNNNIKY